MPKVSVIVPVYNVEEYLDKCLDSLVNQTLNDIEFIIVNDGTTDNSEQIILKYKEKYPSKIVYLKKENGGLSDARNFGMPYAKGDYIAFLDSDDYVELDTYEKLYNRAIQTDADMVECDFYWEYSDKKIHDTSANYKDESDMYANARVVAWNKLYKKDLIINSGIKFPKGLRYEDLEFFYKILPQLKKIELINEPLIHYVQRDDSITYVQNEKTADIFAILDNIINYYKWINLYNEYNQELEYMYVRILFGSSFKRMLNIKDKETRRKLLMDSYFNAFENFPDWKSNKILNSKKSLKNLFLKSINIYTYKLYCFILK